MEEVANKMPELYEALAKFQSKLQVMDKTAEVKAGSYSFKYTPLDEIMKNVYPILSENGLAIRHEINENGVEAVLSHKAGGELRSGAIQINRSGKMQDIGGQLTYARRYTVTALLGIASDEDADAGDLTVGEKKQTAKDAAQNIDIEPYRAKLVAANSIVALKQAWTALPLAAKENLALQQLKEEMKEMFETTEPVVDLDKELEEDTAEPPEDEFADVPMDEDDSIEKINAAHEAKAVEPDPQPKRRR